MKLALVISKPKKVLPVKPPANWKENHLICLRTGIGGAASYLHPRPGSLNPLPQAAARVAHPSMSSPSRDTAHRTGMPPSGAQRQFYPAAAQAASPPAAQPRLQSRRQPKDFFYSAALQSSPRPSHPHLQSNGAAAASSALRNEAVSPRWYQVNGSQHQKASPRLPYPSHSQQTLPAYPLGGKIQSQAATPVSSSSLTAAVSSRPQHVPFTGVGAQRVLPTAGMLSSTPASFRPTFRPQMTSTMTGVSPLLSNRAMSNGAPLAFMPTSPPSRCASPSYGRIVLHCKCGLLWEELLDGLEGHEI